MTEFLKVGGTSFFKVDDTLLIRQGNKDTYSLDRKVIASSSLASANSTDEWHVFGRVNADKNAWLSLNTLGESGEGFNLLIVVNMACFTVPLSGKEAMELLLFLTDRDPDPAVSES